MDQKRRALHWVIRVGSLRTYLDFASDVIGLRVLRHEEFDSGCEATCNGPYGGAWSKTMIGTGPEEATFAMEITYNYGINGYSFGNDLQYLALAVPSAMRRAKALGYSVDEAKGIIHGPDNYNFRVCEPVPGRAEQFAAVGLRVSDLERSKAYWCGLLGMTELPVPPSLATDDPSALVSFGDGQVALQLIQVSDGQAVEHSESGGRIAFACESVPPIHEAVSAAGHTVLTPPLTLPTPGKADVVVTILADPDGYEICFVEDVAFYQLAEPLYDVVDWAARTARGGDGAPPPQHEEIEHGPLMDSAATVDELKAKMDAAGDRPVVLDFGASWCKKCKKIAPFMEEQAASFSQAKFILIDIAAAEDIAMEYDVSAVPRVLVYRGGEKVADYAGSTEADLRRLLSENVGGAAA
mmetsp:Transcript_20094/g.68117  ORF Transcript_20094/g.68117 Transcript_20094/m.68117 type:complete len:410 (+) Transcript_20094:19-1248(+)